MNFSIIVPIYNVEKYLSQCIESIIGQTYLNWELILVDDGSTDLSNEICCQYAEKESKIKLFVKENSGQADSRNLGIEKASGDYLIFVDADDYIAKDTLQRCNEVCIAWNNPEVIISEGMYEFKDSVIIEKRHWESKDYQGMSGRDTLIKTMKTASNWSPCGKCYRLDFWKQHRFRFPKGRLAEDFALIDRVVLEADCVVMISSFYFYRRFGENSTSALRNKQWKYDELLNLIDWEAYLDEKELDNELLLAFRKTFAKSLCHNILGNMYLFEKEEKKEMFRMIKKLLFYLDYTEEREEKIIRCMLKIIGLNWTCVLLGILKRYRIKKEKLIYKD